MVGIESIVDLDRRIRSRMRHGRRWKLRYYTINCIAYASLIAVGVVAGTVLERATEEGAVRKRSADQRAALAMLDIVGPELVLRHSLKELQVRLSLPSPLVSVVSSLQSTTDLIELNNWLLLSDEQRYGLISIAKSYERVAGQVAPYPCALAPTDEAVRRGTERLWTCIVLIPAQK